jgi:hypothetical protein
MTAKVRVHKEWFRRIKKRSCSCGNKRTDVYSWGEYRNAKWHTVEYVCQACWNAWAAKLNSHKQAAGCTFQLVGKDCKLPTWLTLNVSDIDLPASNLSDFIDQITAS